MVFDLGDTLVRFDNREPHLVWERRLGLAAGTLWQAVAAAADWRDAFLGRDEDEHWELTAEALGFPLTDLPALRADFFACERLEDDLLKFACHLCPKYRTGILFRRPREYSDGHGQEVRSGQLLRRSGAVGRGQGWEARPACLRGGSRRPRGSSRGYGLH